MSVCLGVCLWGVCLWEFFYLTGFKFLRKVSLCSLGWPGPLWRPDWLELSEICLPLPLSLWSARMKDISHYAWPVLFLFCFALSVLKIEKDWPLISNINNMVLLLKRPVSF